MTFHSGPFGDIVIRSRTKHDLKVGLPPAENGSPGYCGPAGYNITR